MSGKPKVYLIGAGPGDPELLTLKALRLMQQADVIVYDRLVSPEIMDFVPSGTTRIFVGKESGAHSHTQHEINELLVQLAQPGRCVVRLKGGDPYIFGRGSEEALHLLQHGIDFEVVPGITAASACSAYAGIPLTHRGLARGVTFLTGHFREEEPLGHDWSQLCDPQLTLIFYMGLANLEQITARLIAAGRTATTPAAVVENASHATQRRVHGTLATLPALARQHGIGAPALVIIGEVVTLADQLDWFTPSLQAATESSYALGQ